MAHFLIDGGSNINSRDEKGFSPSHVASRRGHVHVAQLLLLDCGSDVNARETQSWTPLQAVSMDTLTSHGS